MSSHTKEDGNGALMNTPRGKQRNPKEAEVGCWDNRFNNDTIRMHFTGTKTAAAVLDRMGVRDDLAHVRRMVAMLAQKKGDCRTPMLFRKQEG